MGKKYARKRDRSSKIVGILVTIFLLLSAAFAYELVALNRMSASREESAEETQKVEKLIKQIAIPGYEAIHLQADTTKQTLAFRNPEENNCYFLITLELEDGTVLWQSDLVEPGKISKPVVLNQPLAVGTYSNAVLRYACFSFDSDKKPLNGAETKLAIFVE